MQKKRKKGKPHKLPTAFAHTPRTSRTRSARRPPRPSLIFFSCAQALCVFSGFVFPSAKSRGHPFSSFLCASAAAVDPRATRDPGRKVGKKRKKRE
ncbi:hypothetical protein [Pandoravirus japonicus]|uniref:Transmembrane protein n=1 Tax=Pandoravirus japonicus TaxID=2823154 RepID=A0A811BP03_9VIRU|nr:hypothetical protein [Pandoravirus japonicus]